MTSHGPKDISLKKQYILVGPKTGISPPSVDVAEKKGAYAFMTGSRSKSISLKNKQLLVAGEPEKKGAPKMTIYL